MNNRIHISPDDFLCELDEIADGSEPRSRCKLYIEPYGKYGLNEVCEANYFAGNRVPYHDHVSGYETFLVDGGSFEVYMANTKAVAVKGDIVHVVAYAPHSIHVLEDNSIWRAFHQGMYFYKHLYEDRAMRDRHWDTALDHDVFIDGQSRDGTRWFDYMIPEAKEISANDFTFIRPFDSALAEYTFEGITLKLKVGRWETNGAKEVWMLHMKSGYKLSWNELNPHDLLYDVFSGSVRVTPESGNAFVAKARDMIHFPRVFAGSIEALEDTVLIDAGCQGGLTPFMDEINFLKKNDSAKLQDYGYVESLMKKYDYNVNFESLL